MPRDDEPDRTSETEGVRIIGAEEAAEALERGDVAHRRTSGEPRFGDRPAAPAADGPRPALRFPLPAGESAARPTSAGGRDDDDTALPHWTEPATGEVPRIFAAEDLDEDAGAWSAFSSGQPRWRGEGSERRADDDYDDFSRLADEETRIGAMADDDRPGPDDFFDFDDEESWDDQPAPVGGGYEEEWEDGVPSGRTRAISSDPRRSTPAGRRVGGFERPTGAGRNLPVAVGVGVAFAVAALICFAVGQALTVALILVVLTIAAVELFSVLRQAGYQPATLLGLSAVAALPLAAYWRGPEALPLVLFLTVAFGLCWYLAGAGGQDRPVIGLSSTLLGVTWVGVLGSFAALMLQLGTTTSTGTAVAEPGIGILLVAVIGTIGYDIGGFAVGRNAGIHPLSAASPNKTVEGLGGGIVAAILFTLLAATFIAPFSEIEFGEKVLLGLAVAVAAPLGDLCQSLVKRDLDVKDMGTILPGHGGFLDRFDALLFVLPTVYYVARILLF